MTFFLLSFADFAKILIHGFVLFFGKFNITFLDFEGLMIHVLAPKTAFWLSILLFITLHYYSSVFSVHILVSVFYIFCVRAVETVD